MYFMKTMLEVIKRKETFKERTSMKFISISPIFYKSYIVNTSGNIYSNNNIQESYL